MKRTSGRGGLLRDVRFHEIERYFERGEKLRLVLNHRRQADNALRLGLIDGQRYTKTIERLDGKRKRCEEQEETLRTLMNQGGFLADLPTDRVAQGKQVKAKLVPDPGCFDERLERLSDDQQAEYLLAFQAGTSLALTKKYAQVRLTSLLRSMILHCQHVDLEAIERECRGLSAIHGDSTNDLYLQTAKVARFLSHLDPERRLERLNILRELDARARDPLALTITISLAAELVQSNLVDSSFQARPHPEYLKLVQAPVSRLRLALRNKVNQNEGGAGAGAGSLEPRYGTSQVTKSGKVAERGLRGARHRKKCPGPLPHARRGA